MAITAPPGADPRLLSAIEKASRDFEMAIATSDAASIAALYTPDAVFVSLDGTATSGRAQIKQLYRRRFASLGSALEIKIESQQLMVDRDMAYESGRSSITRRTDDHPMTERARFLTIWQRQPDGDWKIFRNIVLPGR